MLASHSGATLPLWLALDPAWTARVEPLVSGSTGVQVFFVLSGFLITRLLADELGRTGTLGLRRFAARRLWRLAPPYAVFLLTVGALLSAGALEAAYGNGLALAAVYGYNAVSRDAYSAVLGSTWSLAIEEQFYLVWPALLLAARRWPLAALVAVTASLVALDLWIGTTLWAETHFVERWPSAVFPTLFIGCGAALLWTRGVVPRRWTPWLVAAGAAYAVTVWAPGLDASLAYLVRSLGVAVGVVWTVAHPASRTVRVLEWAPLRHVGRWSYSLYLWQCLFLTTGPAVWAADYVWTQGYGANVVRAARAGVLDLLWLPPFNLMATGAVAWLSYHAVERPSLALRARLAARPSRPEREG